MHKEIYKQTQKYAIDIKKLNMLLDQKYKMTAQDAAEKLGLNRYYFTRYNNRNKGLNRVVINALEQEFGISYEMIKPEEPVKSLEKEPVKEASTADLTKLEEQMKSAVEHLRECEEFLELMKQGFRVQTKPMISSQDISMGVREGVSMWWNANGGDIIKKIRSAMYAAFYDVLHSDAKNNGGQK